MSVTPQNLRDRWPAFADASAWPDVVVQLALTDAALELEEDVWCLRFDPGTIALAAHMLELGARTSAAGAGNAGQGGVQMIKTGDEQIAFAAVGAATAKGDEVSLRTTPYGLEFLRIQAMVPRPFFVVI